MSSPAKLTPADLQAESLARDIAAEMPSPYCPGRSIASCPSEAARELEDDILGLAKQGQDRAQIEGVLVARFGEDKMGTAQQSEILVAILLGVALALAMIVFAARKWLRPAGAQLDSGEAASAAGSPGSPGSPGSLATVSPDELDRLEDELDEIDGI